MDSTLIVGAISAIFGGAIGAFLKFRIGNRQQDESGFTALVTEYKGLVDKYKADLDSLRAEVDAYRADIARFQVQLHEKDKDIIQLRNQVMIFENSHSDTAIPMWLKNVQGEK